MRSTSALPGLLYALNPEVEIDITITWTPKVGKILAFMAIIMGLGPLFYILLGFRYLGSQFTKFTPVSKRFSNL